MAPAVRYSDGVLRRLAADVPYSPRPVTILRERADPIKDLEQIAHEFGATLRDPMNRRAR